MTAMIPAFRPRYRRRPLAWPAVLPEGSLVGFARQMAVSLVASQT
jgi:hypothetical protein